MECPACLGVAMESASVADGLKVHHCGRCGGTWLRGAQIPRLREVPASALRTMITRRDDASFLCHGCHQPMERDAGRCEACEWRNTLDCPDCGKPMHRERRRDVTVDVCRGCKAVWLDHHELDSLWAVAAAGAVAATQQGQSLLAAGADAGDFLLEALWYAPDLTVNAVGLTVRAAGAGVEALSHAPGLLASLPELLGGFAEVAADVAGAVFGLIAEIIGGLFDGI
jgi:Zn-finger nucleic acid-binding protein